MVNVQDALTASLCVIVLMIEILNLLKVLYPGGECAE